MAAKDTAKKTVKNPITVKLKKVLDIWLSSHSSWTHQVWLDLLAQLDESKVGELTQTQEGLDAIGLYLEQNR